MPCFANISSLIPTLIAFFNRNAYLMLSHFYIINYWRASVASETLTGVKMKKSGMFVYLFVYMYGRT